MKLLTQALFLLFSSVSCLRFESNIPGYQDSPEKYAEIVEWARDMTVGGGPVDYVGLFNADEFEFEGDDYSSSELLTNFKANRPENYAFVNNDTFAENVKLHCPFVECLDQKQEGGFKLSKKAKDGNIDKRGCKDLSRIVPAGSGVGFALVGSSVCEKAGDYLVACTLGFGAAGGVLGDFGKDFVVDKFCKREDARANKKCNKQGFILDCTDNHKRNLQFIRNYHKRSFTCKQVKKQFDAKKRTVKCKNFENN